MILIKYFYSVLIDIHIYIFIFVLVIIIEYYSLKFSKNYHKFSERLWKNESYEIGLIFENKDKSQIEHARYYVYL